MKTLKPLLFSRPFKTFLNVVCCSVIMFGPEVITAQPGASSWPYIEIDSNKGKWGNWDEPNWLRYFGLDRGDVNGDGYQDILSEKYIYHNPRGDMTGKWARTELPQNGDGDHDLLGAGWDNYQYMHLWRNDFTDQYMKWKHLSTTRKELPMTNGSNQQTAALVADVNGDGAEDIFIADRTVAPSVIGLIYSPDGWQRHIIDADPLRIEAGSAAHDIDGDGDLDIVFGGESRSNEIWWWENPYPNFDPQLPWQRRTIKKSGGNKHHDQMFIDVDADGSMELVFWNQGSNGLFYAEMPENPKSATEWEIHPIYTYASDGEMAPRSSYPDWRKTHEHEGLDALDMNGDGKTDIIGGGRWFEYSEGKFVEHIIDASYTFTRSCAGQLIDGGRPEVVMVVGDGMGPLVLYEWENGFWQSRVLIEMVDNGHTLDILDANGDGHLDVFNAEMRFGEGNPDAEIRILMGDGKGNFHKHVVARGIGVHEGRMADLDGDGDLDILGKPYTWEAPRLDIWLNQAKP